MQTKRMLRQRPRMLAGVCSGLAEHTGLPVVVVRLGMVVFAFAGGAGVVLYLWLWLLAPDVSDERRRGDGAGRSIVARMLQRPAADPHGVADRAEEAQSSVPGASPLASVRGNPALPVVVGVALVALALAIAAFGVPLQIVVPGALAVVGVLVSWGQLVRAGSVDARGVAWRVAGGLGLVAVGVVLFFAVGGRSDSLAVAGAIIAVLGGAAVAVGPWALRLVRDLANERAERARANERAEIAAHLHDSVLQSLALIQQKSAPGGEVARIARQQERELREWLFVQDAGFRDVPAGGGGEHPVDVASELRRVAARLEHDHACTFDVVVVGIIASPHVDALLAAAGEAMTNAARHAGGAVSVFAEAGKEVAEVTVTDRGPGVDLDAIPEDRHGIRHSIMARMARAGGTAVVGAGPGGRGTRVRLRIPVRAAESGPELRSGGAASEEHEAGASTQSPSGGGASREAVR